MTVGLKVIDGISDLDSEQIIYPNPVTANRLNLPIGSTWRLLNQQGKLVASGKGEMVDFKNYPKGVYILELNNEKRLKVIYQ